MWLDEITLKDFRCFHGEHTIEFSMDPDENVTLIHAENGVGKTTLLNAMLWCFYGTTTAKFERKQDLVNHDAKAAGRDSCYVEVLFEHNDKRYRARRFHGNGTMGGREFSIMRIDDGHSVSIDNPDSFINTVIPKTMAGHFLFDGEHAEVFLGEENRRGIRKAVQDILGCNLIETAIEDLEETAAYYRRQMPKAKATDQIEVLSNEIDRLTDQLKSGREALDGLKGQAEQKQQQIADIEAKLRNSAAARELQASRDRANNSLKRAITRAASAQDELLKWLGDNGRFLVSSRNTEKTFDHLEAQDVKGRIPSPYNEEFVQDILEMEECICGTELKKGSTEYEKVRSLLQKAANKTLRSRLSSVRSTLKELKREREKAPGRLDAANKRLAEARHEISAIEAELGGISDKLSGIDFDEIAERERRRNELRGELDGINRQIGALENNLRSSEASKANKERELNKLLENDEDARIFVRRHELCERLKERLEAELVEEEEDARKILRSQISKVLQATTRKSFKLRLTDEYAVALVNEEGTQLPKSSGENQLLGLAFTAALVEYARLRQNAQDHRLLRGTVAPLVLDSPFGQLDDSYRETTGEHVPRMASQVVLMVSGSQANNAVIDVLRARVGKEYVLVRTNRASGEGKKGETRQFNGKDYAVALFDQEADGTRIEEIVR